MIDSDKAAAYIQTMPVDPSTGQCSCDVLVHLVVEGRPAVHSHAVWHGTRLAQLRTVVLARKAIPDCQYGIRYLGVPIVPSGTYGMPGAVLAWDG